MHPILIESTYKLKMTDKVYILHYMTQPKPWDLYNLDIDHTFENTQCAELFKLWLHLYNEMIEIKYFSLKKIQIFQGIITVSMKIIYLSIIFNINQI